MFLARAGAALGVDLALGRDGSAPSSYQDVVEGRREDRQLHSLGHRRPRGRGHAARRPPLRRHRPRHAPPGAQGGGALLRGRQARTASTCPAGDLGHLPAATRSGCGATRWTTCWRWTSFRGCCMRTPFSLAQMVPKPYERIATSGTGQGLIEPLLVRAYLMHGQALPGGTSRGGSYAGGRTDLFTSGVVRHVVKADVASLYPSLMLTYKIGPRSDHLGAFLALLRELTTLRLAAQGRGAPPPARQPRGARHEAASGAMKQLINSFYGSLGTSFALFGDLDAAGEVTRRGREVLGPDAAGAGAARRPAGRGRHRRRAVQRPGLLDRGRRAAADRGDRRRPSRTASAWSTTAATPRCTATRKRTTSCSGTTGRSGWWAARSARVAASGTASSSCARRRRCCWQERFEELRGAVPGHGGSAARPRGADRGSLPLGDPLEEPGHLRARAAGARSSTRCCSGPAATAGRAATA